MDEPLIPIPVPALVALLLNREKAKGSALTKEEVESIRDKAVCIMMRLSMKKTMDDSRGYEDIDPEYAWEQWQRVRTQLGQTG